MLIFCCLAVFWQNLMPFNLSNDREGIDITILSLCYIGSKLNDLFPFLLLVLLIKKLNSPTSLL